MKSYDVIKSAIFYPPSWVSLFSLYFLKTSEKAKIDTAFFQNNNGMLKCTNTAMMLKKTGKVFNRTKNLI